MSNAPPEVIEPAGPRRRFSVAQKLAIVAETRRPGVRFVDVARRHRVRAGQLYKWRRLVELGMIGIPGASELPSFIAVEMRDGPGASVEPAGERLDPVLEPAPCRAAAGFIEIDLGHGRCVRVDTHVDADALARVLSVLDRR